MSRPSPEQDGRSRDGEPSRKRVRKGTKSCWECKRRKIRCQLSTEDVAVCSGCRARGTTCLSQEFPEEHDSGTNVGERLGRVELLLEKLVAKMPEYEEEEKATQIETPESMGSNDVYTPFTASAMTNLFDPGVIVCGDTIALHTQNCSTPSELPTSQKPQSRPSKTDRLQKALIALLPSQHDANIIFGESECWLLLHALNKHSADVFDPQNIGFHVSTTFDMSAISKESPTQLGRTLLYLAICIQQLPSHFDTNSLQLTSGIDLYMRKIILTIQPLVTSDDEIVSSLEGLECLVLQGVYHINSGNPRRAWLSFRRAINFAQLMGLHKSDDDIMDGGKALWYHIERADRYLALLLGLPPGSSSIPLRPEENFQNPAMDKDMLFSRSLCEVADRLIARNDGEDIATYTTTQAIDEKLEGLAHAMPEEWWAIPGVFAPNRTAEAALQFDRLFLQIWYFQLQGLVHLPFMLRASKERKYDYSRFICLKSSRALIHRYLALRYREKSFCCKVIDFAPLTATITIFLGLLDTPIGEETRESKQQRECDRILVHTLLQAMEGLHAIGGDRDLTTSQSVSVIRALLKVESSHCATNNLRVTIPYFGTVNIVRTLNGNSSTSIVQEQQALPDHFQVQPDTPFSQQRAINAPMVQFTSSQFAPMPLEQSLKGWDLTEADTLFFDSLLHTDIEGVEGNSTF